MGELSDILLGTPIGGGAFGDVYEATDRLGRKIAVKLIRSSMGVGSMVINQAKALARIKHPNVVTVHDVQTIIDPKSGMSCQGILMEFVDGLTLSQFTATNCVSRTDALRVGQGIAQGLKAIHASGLTHGDLHNDNVLISDTSVKIIDILYINTLASLDQTRQQNHKDRDCIALRMLLRYILCSANIAESEVDDFGRRLKADSTIDDMLNSFNVAINATKTLNRDFELRRAIELVDDEEFVKGPEYADAVLQSLLPAVDLEVLRYLLDNRRVKHVHGHLLRGVWLRMSSDDQSEIASAVNDGLMSELPKGRWPAFLICLLSCQAQMWSMLSPACQIRTESVLVNDVMNGQYNINQSVRGHSGTLGAWSIYLWRRFKNPGLLASTLIGLLRRDWHTQNYVGKYFMPTLSPLGDATNTRQDILDALAIAISNDARLVRTGLSSLPEEWQNLLKAEEPPF